LQSGSGRRPSHHSAPSGRGFEDCDPRASSRPSPRPPRCSGLSTTSAGQPSTAVHPGPRAARVGRPCRPGRTRLGRPGATATGVRLRSAVAVVTPSHRLVAQATRHPLHPLRPRQHLATPQSRLATSQTALRSPPLPVGPGFTVPLRRAFLRCYRPPTSAAVRLDFLSAGWTS
jgi:hypothetical protein